MKEENAELDVDKIIQSVSLAELPTEEKVVKTRKKRKGYFDNPEMIELFKLRQSLEGRELNLEEEKLLYRTNNKIGKLYLKVAMGMMRRPNFINYPEMQQADMISDALFCMNRAGERYNTDFPNPFAYFSQITWHAYIQSIKNMKKREKLFVIVNHLENIDGFDEIDE